MKKTANKDYVGERKRQTIKMMSDREMKDDECYIMSQDMHV